MSTLSKYLLFLSVFIISAATAFAQDQETKVLDKEDKEYENLKDKGKKSIDNGNYPDALEYFIKAEAIVEKNPTPEKLFSIKNCIGIAYRYLSNSGEALNNYKQALEFAKDNPELEIKVLNNIGVLYALEKDYPNALHYYKKTLSLVEDKNIKYDKVTLTINLSDIYNRLNNVTEAKKCLMSIKNSPKTRPQSLVWQINYAESLMLEGQLTEAQKMMEQLIPNINNKNDTDVYMGTVDLLAKIYAKQNKTDLAIVYAKKGLNKSQSIEYRFNLYNQLSTLYLKNKDYDTAFKYKDSVIIARDSMSGVINKGLYQTNKIKLKFQEYQKELSINQEKHKAERIIFIICIISSLLIFFSVYRVLKNRITKQKQEKIITENQQKIFTLEMENLKNNIAEKNRKLSAKALYLTGRNELIAEVMNSLSEIPEVAKNNEIANYMKTLKSYLKTDAEWDDFIAYFEKVNPDFIKTLQERHPLLTAQDLRFICYIYMNLDLKEISTILNITLEACKKRKQRIAKKMEIEPDDLHEYIIKLT
ncbi:tetratricopeptide repeat protein [Flavobacterium cerinum]|nr:tetratricopeptide repeat protein [Flavobacterium cerinum]